MISEYKEALWLISHSIMEQKKHVKVLSEEEDE
jgi:hypothetical protein